MITELYTFIAVAEEKSFYKAANKLYLSNNATKKRIIHLEESIGIKLFYRTVKGEVLTKAGEAFYNDVKKLLISYENSIERAKMIQKNDTNILRIGEMDTFSYEFLMAPWYDVRNQLSQNKTQIFYYGLSNNELESMLKSVGKDIDIAVDIYDEQLAKKAGLLAIELSQSMICCGIPKNHCLSRKKKVLINDLSHQKVYILRQNRSKIWDQLREELKEKCPQLIIKDIEKYDIKMFNKVFTDNDIILICDKWKKLYPFINYLPLEKDYSIPFGIYYSTHPTQKVKNVINTIKNYSPLKNV